MYDAVIIGASFAGLAVANELRDHRVLLIDRKPVGSGQTSACGTILQVLEHWDLTHAVLQRHDQLVLHTPKNTLTFPSPYAWCTFDYRQLCESLFSRSKAKFLLAAALEGDARSVTTTQGTIRARCVIDASGWTAAVVSSYIPKSRGKNSMNFGIETIVPLANSHHFDREALHFWYDPDNLGGPPIAWIFPRNNEVSVGLGSYYGVRLLKNPLRRFAVQYSLTPDGLHGTYLPHTLRSPVVEGIFVVGDAAGMCLGLTGEGIRPALFFGEACGRIVQRVLADEISLQQGLRDYRAFVERRRPFFSFFSRAQALITNLDPAWFDRLSRLIHLRPVRSLVLQEYWKLTDAWSPTRIHG